MFKHISVLEVKGNEKRMYKFYCDPKSPLGEVHDALTTMKIHVLEQMKLQEQKEKDESQKDV